jgi:hypothetical protein
MVETVREGDEEVERLWRVFCGDLVKDIGTA